MMGRKTLVKAHIGLVAAALFFAMVGSRPAAHAQDGSTLPGPMVSLEVAAVEITQRGTLALSTGEEIVLIGLDVGMGLMPVPDAYRAEIQRLVRTGGPWRLDTRTRDRYGRWAGRVETANGIWIQEHLLRLGLARFAGGVPTVLERQALLAAEKVARDAMRGLWRHPRFALRKGDQPDEIYDGFRVVEGRVQAVGRGDGVVYLNFGEDWRTDFTAGVTVRLGSDALPVGADGEALSVFDLEGRWVRLRGVVRRYNGPFMEIAAEDQIEVLRSPGIDPIRLRSASPWGYRSASGSTL